MEEFVVKLLTNTGPLLTLMLVAAYFVFRAFKFLAEWGFNPEHGKITLLIESMQHFISSVEENNDQITQDIDELARCGKSTSRGIHALLYKAHAEAEYCGDLPEEKKTKVRKKLSEALTELHGVE